MQPPTHHPCPAPSEPRVCQRCGLVSAHVCAGCTARYCSCECQLSDWSDHCARCPCVRARVNRLEFEVDCALADNQHVASLVDKARARERAASAWLGQCRLQLHALQRHLCTTAHTLASLRSHQLLEPSVPLLILEPDSDSE